MTSQSKIEGSAGRKKVVILGGGPGGLTIGKFLREDPRLEVVVLEKEGRIGGRCLSVSYSDHIVEFGTCYAVFAHRRLLKWMRRNKIKLRRIKTQLMDGEVVMRYVRGGDGAPLVVQAIRYLLKRRGLMRRLERGDRAAAVEASRPAAEWLRENKLYKIERLMHRVVTTLGYGYLSEVPLLHALRWVNFDMFLTGIFDYLIMPVCGWERFWQLYASDLTVRLGFEAMSIERGVQGVSVIGSNGDVVEGDILINTLALDEFAKLAEPTHDEQAIAESVGWGRYALTLIAAEKWFDDADVYSWTASAVSPDTIGGIFVARREIHDPEMGGDLFSIGQAGGPYSDEELGEILLADAIRHGATSPRVVRQVLWRYAPTYNREALANGLLATMRAVQGPLKTFHTGSSFSHEAVSHITEFNVDLAKQIRATL
ncbi:MAG: FAD-dependent oxidoreductase [Pseudomonadota bacterium]